MGHVLACASCRRRRRLVVRHERDAVAAAIADLMRGGRRRSGRGASTGAVELGLGALYPRTSDGDIVVVSGDVPLLDAATLARLLDEHRSAAAAATLLSAIVDDATGYGRIVRDAAGAMQRLGEQKDATPDELSITEINSGTYVFGVAGLRTQLGRVGTSNAQGEKYLTDVIALLHDAGQAVTAVPVNEPWVIEGVNDRVQLARTAARLNAMIVRGWQLAGVTVQDPATTWIDLRATLAEDVELLPGTHIAGATTIARGARIGPQTTLLDCEVGEDAVVTRSDATLAVIGSGSTVGPFAYLRPGTELAADGKIGTFVETKNAKIGAGSKVPHLSYIGDTTVGEGSNIGAGTITANYDGVNKHSTTVGSHVRTGSHNVFVAPVTIGDGAYSGAGTVIRKDVPAGALAVNVAPQRNLAGWVQANRAGTRAADAAAAASGSVEGAEGSVEGAEGTD
ncbi:MAG: bifunctional UDP-N-acetylglucosamine diphosphorylase/glucosamine-1-phosphate N-acetyltransferase GlmU [Schumannella sp.]